MRRCERRSRRREGDRALAAVDIVVTARSGVDGTSMLSFGRSYTPEELHDIASYIEHEILPRC
jgi:hypothetical protein